MHIIEQVLSDELNQLSSQEKQAKDIISNIAERENMKSKLLEFTTMEKMKPRKGERFYSPSMTIDIR